MINLILADLYKLRKSWYLTAGFMVSCLAAAIFAIISHRFALGTISLTVAGPVSLLSDLQMMSLLGSCSTALIICSDFENHQLQNAIAAGVGRFQLVAGKMVVFIIMTTLWMLPYLITAMIGFVSQYEFAAFAPSVFLGVMKEGIHTPMTVALFGRILVIALTTLIIYSAQLSLTVFISFALRKTAPAIMISYIFFFACGQLYSMDNVITTILSYTPYGADFAAMTIYAEPSVFLHEIAVSLPYLLAIIGLTWLLFRKSEIR